MYKRIAIFDFDNTIYYNPKNDFTDNIIENNIIHANKHFYNIDDFEYLILITGRVIKKLTIDNLLEPKGYYFDKVISSDLPLYNFPEIIFNILYENWKIYQIAKTIIDIIQNSTSKHTIYILDDNKPILDTFSYSVRFNSRILLVPILVELMKNTLTHELYSISNIL